jgi:histidinol phosphatase-like PHP family hydrolase
MERTCERAVELGLPAVAFTEHADSGGWAVLASDLDEYPHLRAFVTEDRVPGDPVGGTLRPRGQLPPEIVRWWREEGGDAVSFGSDAHDPTGLARGFAAATVMVEEAGFRPGRLPHDVWRRLR